MKRTALALTLTLTLLISSVSIVHPAKSTPRTIIVPDNFPTIPEAVRNATAGDTVYVRAGNYTIPPAWEYGIEIGNSVTLRGENPNTTIIATTEMTSLAFGVGYGIVLRDDAEISGFTITGNLIVLHQFGNGRITNNIINLTGNGECAIWASSGTISSNVINGADQGVNGLHLGTSGIDAGSPANLVISNNVIDGFGMGINVGYRSKGVRILNNTLVNNAIGLFISEDPGLLEGNNVVNSTAHALNGMDNINATYNWWGTTDAQKIAGSITTGLHTGVSVTFTPFLTEPNPQAMPVERDFAPPVLPSSVMDVAYWTAVAVVLVIAATIGIGILLYFKKYKSQSE